MVIAKKMAVKKDLPSFSLNGSFWDGGLRRISSPDGCYIHNFWGCTTFRFFDLFNINITGSLTRI
jgi:hypothetical protein